MLSIPDREAEQTTPKLGYRKIYFLLKQNIILL